jgi:hypothetical protein
MKKKAIITAMTLTASATVIPATPVYASPVALSDSQLDAVSGKDNTSTVRGVDTTVIGGLKNIAGNVQVGYYQWDDDHETDASLNKGGNVQSGEHSMVQQYAMVMANQVAWGGASQSITINSGAGASVGGSQTLEDWWIMYLGGF